MAYINSEIKRRGKRIPVLLGTYNFLCALQVLCKQADEFCREFVHVHKQCSLTLISLCDISMIS